MYSLVSEETSKALPFSHSLSLSNPLKEHHVSYEYTVQGVSWKPGQNSGNNALGEK